MRAFDDLSPTASCSFLNLRASKRTEPNDCCWADAAEGAAAEGTTGGGTYSNVDGSAPCAPPPTLSIPRRAEARVLRVVESSCFSQSSSGVCAPISDELKPLPVALRAAAALARAPVVPHFGPKQGAESNARTAEADVRRVRGVSASSSPSEGACVKGEERGRSATPTSHVLLRSRLPAGVTLPVRATKDGLMRKRAGARLSSTSKSIELRLIFRLCEFARREKANAPARAAAMQHSPLASAARDRATTAMTGTS